MNLTCANCGYINEGANETTTNCPNCGAPYGATTTYADVAATPPPPPPPAMTVAAPFSETPPTSQSRRRSLLIGLGVALAVVVLLAGGFVAYAAGQRHPLAAAVATVTPSPTSPTTKITYQAYSDPQGQFSLKYPSTWTTSTSTATVQGASTNLTMLLAKGANGAATGGVIVAVGGTNLTLQNVGDILTSDGLTGFTTSGSPTTQTAKNGTSWQVVRGTATTAKGKTADIAAAFAQHGANTYLVIGIGKGKDSAKVFAYMLKSMTLGASV